MRRSDFLDRLLFSLSHEYVKVGDNNKAKIGITDHAQVGIYAWPLTVELKTLYLQASNYPHLFQKELGDVVYVDFSESEIGKTLEAGGESMYTALDISNSRITIRSTFQWCPGSCASLGSKLSVHNSPLEKLCSNQYVKVL